MKTYGWLSPEKLKFINENPQVLSLLYDLGLLPEEISARVRAIVEEELKDANRLIQTITKCNCPGPCNAHGCILQALLLLRERFDIYADHLKTCVVYIEPSIPCDCHFLDSAEKRKGEPECDCVVPALDGAGQHSPSCAIFKKRKCDHAGSVETADGRTGLRCGKCGERLR